MATILYIEDNDDNLFMLSRRLRRRGFDVLAARDGEEGVESALNSLPDLILMDLVLPVMDGWEATAKLKSLPETMAIPVIAVSSHAMSGDREKALAAGCDDYHTKPIDFERLLIAINSYLVGPGESQ
ncbi:MAG: response regulator [Gammaproteobacteria bacterium]|jgi:CheY-like chemotaxis protein|nr:response regulator [Gammaproteobacteria bacterium]NCF81198.1 response regulator [Pseudomonadota bacterium]